MNSTERQYVQCIYPVVRYDDAKAGIVWLTSVLGFEEQVVYPGEGDSIAHAQLVLGGNVIMLGSGRGAVTGAAYIALDSPAHVDAANERAKAAGANITRELCDTDYGSHEF